MLESIYKKLFSSSITEDQCSAFYKTFNTSTWFSSTIACLSAQASAYTWSVLEHLLVAWLAYVAVCVIVYRLLNRGHRLRYESKLRPAKRVLCVTAHPDDECMFFGPTLYKLTQEENIKVFLLCMSCGDHDGLGKQRREELWKACEKLGISASNIFLYKCTLLPDSPGTKWRADIVARIILKHVESLDIDALITFDKHGVSNHTNHSSLYYAVAYLSIEKLLPELCKVYTLESINLLRKYWLILDVPLSFILSTHRYILQWKQRKVVINAMKQHVSQFVWFRRLYVRFSRYLIINTFQQLDLIDLELDLTIDD